MRWAADTSGDLGTHWMITAERDGRQLPVTVVAKWRWYKTGSRRDRLRYAVIEIAALAGSAAIPVAAAAHLDSVVIAALGAFVLIATGIRTTFGLHENWVEHSQIGYAIEREAALFLHSSPPYDRADAVQVLVARVETLSDEGGQQWARRRMSVERSRQVQETPRKPVE
ncbi:DUF4231 domain-containing protein [Amycolatopsis vastitatis]|uniref:DUF4231 domain-containing protein n=1 Tax=Amycolatopsis vastitatis TaxID=1905142 RepID=A0A229SW38_9PSEU|nr:DUF4231 domain-containing protein [Amycolatopsis vastitatis]OXM62993.1 hypothetical protein CF165_31985 [Amycolatopsis vastitatis]